jgi:hypothetical protein
MCLDARQRRRPALGSIRISTPVLLYTRQRTAYSILSLLNIICTKIVEIDVRITELWRKRMNGPYDLWLRPRKDEVARKEHCIQPPPYFY